MAQMEFEGLEEISDEQEQLQAGKTFAHANAFSCNLQKRNCGWEYLIKLRINYLSKTVGIL